MLVAVDEIGLAAERLDEATVLHVEFGMDIGEAEASTLERRRQLTKRRQLPVWREARRCGQRWLVCQGEMQADRSPADERLDAPGSLRPFRKAGHATRAGQSSPPDQVEDRLGYAGRKTVVVGDQADGAAHAPGFGSSVPLTISRTM